MNINHQSKLTQDNAGNCWIYGCASVVVIGIISAIVAVFGIKYALNKLIENYTDDTPIELPTVEVSEEEKTSTLNRIDTWMQSFESGEEPGPLELSQQDINVMIQNNPELSDFKDRLYVTIEDSEIKGQLSFPLDDIATELGMDSLKGLYFNGSLGLEDLFEDGYLEVYMKNGSLKGEAIPQDQLDMLANQNFAEQYNRDPQMDEAFKNLESIVIEDGKLIITPKVAESSSEAEVVEPEFDAPPEETEAAEEESNIPDAA